MISKYYTPLIEEFHVGFEYEFYMYNEWLSMVYIGDELVNFVDLFDFKEVLKHKQLRVKYLDIGDIESLEQLKNILNYD